MNLNLQRPDLSIRVKLTGKHLTFMVDGDHSLGLVHKEYEPLELKRDPQAYFKQFLQALDTRSTQFNRNQSEKANFERLGMNLFQEVLPRKLRGLLWDLRDHNYSLQIETDEPWIPWELCKMDGQAQNGYRSGPFLCEAFDMTRWYVGVPTYTQLSLQKVAMVVPQMTALPDAQQESIQLSDLLAQTVRVDHVPAEMPAITKAMASGEYDAWHIASHGRQPGDTGTEAASIELDDAEWLEPDCLVGPARAMLTRRPLVFLNNCYSGRGQFSLTQQNGWAWRLVHADQGQGGAGAVIGTLWAVDDAAARHFAVNFYSYLLHGATLARAARLARADVRELGGASYLAYTVYGSPFATIFEPVDWHHRWEEAKKRAGTRWQGCYLRVLLTLAAVQEPVSIDMLATFSDLTDRDDLLAALAFWKEHTKIQPDGNVTHFILVDPVLRKYLDRLDQIPDNDVNMVDVHERIARILFDTLQQH